MTVYIVCVYIEIVDLFIINGVVRFNPEDGSLLKIEGEQEVIIPPRVSSEILFLLIKNNNIILSRDFLLTELWEKKGLSSSNNNLTNYMSLLRKALQTSGVDDVITTIPKVGFMFNAEVVEVQSVKKTTTPLRITKKILYILPLCFLSIYIIVLSKDRFKDSDLVMIGNCSVHFQNKYYQNKSIEEDIKKRLIDYDITCTSPVDVFYSIDKKEFLGTSMQRGLISFCGKNKTGICENYYFFEPLSDNRND